MRGGGRGAGGPAAEGLGTLAPVRILPGKHHEGERELPRVAPDVCPQQRICGGERGWQGARRV